MSDAALLAPGFQRLAAIMRVLHPVACGKERATGLANHLGVLATGFLEVLYLSLGFVRTSRHPVPVGRGGEHPCRGGQPSEGVRRLEPYSFEGQHIYQTNLVPNHM